MKKILSIGMVALLVAALLLGNSSFFRDEVQADVGDQSSIVSVNGVGSISVKPDMAYITVGVETQNDDAGIAQTENSEAMNAVMTAIMDKGIDEEDIKTVQYSVYDRYDYIDGIQQNTYYVVTNLVQITINDIDAVGSIIDVASKAGANSISSIQFGISNEDEVYAQALKLAMASAKNKANAILSTFGKEANMPSKVMETSYNSGALRADYGMAKAEMVMMDTPVSAGELTINANVSVEYTY